MDEGIEMESECGDYGEWRGYSWGKAKGVARSFRWEVLVGLERVKASKSSWFSLNVNGKLRLSERLKVSQKRIPRFGFRIFFS